MRMSTRPGGRSDTAPAEEGYQALEEDGHCTAQKGCRGEGKNLALRRGRAPPRACGPAPRLYRAESVPAPSLGLPAPTRRYLAGRLGTSSPRPAKEDPSPLPAKSR
jgi:hypothetical protein